jgi:hypothetical protein
MHGGEVRRDILSTKARRGMERLGRRPERMPS